MSCLKFISNNYNSKEVIINTNMMDESGFIYTTSNDPKESEIHYSKFVNECCKWRKRLVFFSGMKETAEKSDYENVANSLKDTIFMPQNHDLFDESSTQIPTIVLQIVEYVKKNGLDQGKKIIYILFYFFILLFYYFIIFLFFILSNFFFRGNI